MEFQPSKLHKELERPECREHFKKHYATALSFYEKYLISGGLSCNLTQAALRAIWAMEIERDPEGFEKSLNSGVWD